MTAKESVERDSIKKELDELKEVISTIAEKLLKDRTVSSETFTFKDRSKKTRRKKVEPRVSICISLPHRLYVKARTLVEFLSEREGKRFSFNRLITEALEKELNTRLKETEIRPLEIKKDNKLKTKQGGG